MSRVFKSAVNVSPLIRFSRWSLLVLGVSYGATKHSILQKSNDKTKDLRDKLKIEKEIKMAEEKKKFAAEELKELSLIFIPEKTV